MSNTRHHLSDLPIYRVWVSMIRRCTKPRDQAYRHYGGRGIRVCDRWLDIHNFLIDMGPPGSDQTIERIDNDGHYEPGNCRWATQAEQNDNKRTTVYLEFNGRTQTQRAWAEEFDLPVRAVSERIKRGWTVERALTWPHPTRYADAQAKAKEYNSRNWAANGRRYKGLDRGLDKGLDKAETTARLVELRSQGWGIREIAREVGMPKSTVSWQLQRANC